MSEEGSADLIDVVIIGGGISGCSAGERLKRSCPDLKVVLLEQNDRLGGRIHTDNSSTEEKVGPMELGGQLIAKHETNMLNLIERVGMKTYTAGVPLGNSWSIWSAYWGSNDGSQTPFKIGTRFMPFSFIMGAVELQILVWKMGRLTKNLDLNDPYGSNEK